MTGSPAALVRDFHQLYQVPIAPDGARPTVDFDRAALRMDLIGEEFCELVEAMYGTIPGILVREAFLTATRHDDHRRDVVGTADALADLVYVIYGMALEAGIDLDSVLAEVHLSNLSKLDPSTGLPILREDGKVLKGENYAPPRIARVLGLENAEVGA